MDVVEEAGCHDARDNLREAKTTLGGESVRVARDREASVFFRVC